MLPSTSRASNKTILSLGSSIPSYLLPSFSTWSSPSSSSSPSPAPRPSSSSSSSHQLTQRRSSSTTIDDAHSYSHHYRRSPFPSASALFDSLRSLSQTLQNDIDVNESSRGIGRALGKNFVTPEKIPPPKTPEGFHKYHRIYVTVADRRWSSEKLVLAYASDWGGTETRSRRRTRNEEEEESSSNAVERGEETVDDLLVMEGAPAGEHLREVLSLLELDDETFLLWRKVARSTDVRQALSLLPLQTASSTISPIGDPLWPHWLIAIVMERSSTSLDAHLSTSIMAHHLPWLSLSPTRQAHVLLDALDLLVRFELLASLPEMVNLALSMRFPEEDPSWRSPYASTSSKKRKSRSNPRSSSSSSSELDAGRHISTSTSSSITTAPTEVSTFLYFFDGRPQRWGRDKLPAQFFASIISILTSFTHSHRTHRAPASPILTSQLSRVLALMLAKSIPVLPSSYEQLFRARFLADENFKALLFQHAKRSGRKIPRRFVNAVMLAALQVGKTEEANDCADVLDEMKRLDLASPWKKDVQKLGRKVNYPVIPEDGLPTEEEEAKRWEGLTLSEEEAAANRHELFSSYSTHFLSGIRDPSLAIEYLDTLRLPPRSCVEHVEARVHAGRAFVVLTRILSLPNSHHTSSDLLQVLEQTNLFVNGSLQIQTLVRVMKGLLVRDDHLGFFRLWDKLVEEGQLTPTVEMLQYHTRACREFGTLAAGIKMMDQWSVRQGVHRIIRRGRDKRVDASNKSNLPFSHPPFDVTHVLVHTSPPSPSYSPSSPFDLAYPPHPPVIRVQLDGEIIADLLTTVCSEPDPGGCLEVAFRIWDASEPRWGVTQTIDMLNQILKKSARVQRSEWITRSGKVREWETRELDIRLVEMEDPKPDELDKDGSIDWSKVDIERLFALPPPLDEGEIDLGSELWPRAKWLFEEIVTSNWPFLVDIPHPFDDLFQSTRLPPILGIRPYSPPTSFEEGYEEAIEEEDRSHLSTLPPHHAESLPPLLASPSRLAAAIPPPSLYSHLYPTSETFHHYVCLLLHKGVFDEVSFAFAWMRHLSIFPQRRTIVEALAMLACQAEGSEARLREMKEARLEGREISWLKEGWRKMKRGDQDQEDEDELLRLWLELWLGVKGVPGREEVEMRWEELEMKKKQTERFHRKQYEV